MTASLKAYALSLALCVCALASPAYALTADINRDGIVNFVDLAILAEQFGEKCALGVSLDGIYVLAEVDNSAHQAMPCAGFLVIHRDSYLIQVSVDGTPMSMFGNFDVSGDRLMLHEGTARQMFKYELTAGGIVLRSGTSAPWIRFVFRRISATVSPE